jgi:hypothetical protein
MKLKNQRIVQLLIFLVMLSRLLTFELLREGLSVA